MESIDVFAIHEKNCLYVMIILRLAGQPCQETLIFLDTV